MLDTKDKKFEVVMEQGKDLLEFYRNNPCIALYDLLGIDLAPIQRLLFRDMWFKNYVIGVCSRGLGKSVACDSLVYFENEGLIYLNEKLPKIPPYLMDGEDMVVDWEQSIYTSKGFRNTQKLCLEKNIKGKKIVTKNNFIHKGSNQHPLLTVDDKNNFIYKPIENFKVGDIVCILSGQKVFNNKNVVDADDAYLIGLLTSDSMVIDKFGNTSIIANDHKIIEFCKKYCIKNNVKYKFYYNKKIIDTFGFVFENFNWFIKKYKISKDESKFKHVPYLIRTSSKKSQINFFKGYYDISSILKNKNNIICCSESKQLAKEIQLMLLNFGIIVKVYKEGDDLYLIWMSSKNIKKFNEEIVGEGLNTAKEYYFDTIKSVEDWTGDCYDFMMNMEGEPNYFANGFINHNTFLLGALAVLSSLLYPGYRTGLIGSVFRQSLVISDTYDTFWTNEGLKSTGDEFYSSVKEGQTEIQSLDTQNTILSKWTNPERACRSIKTTRGFELAGTVDHGILTLDEELNLVFKDLQDITEEDNIVIKKGFNYFGNDNSLPAFDSFEMNWRHKDCEVPKELTPDLSYFCGLIMGDGCVSLKKSSRIEFINNDKVIINEYVKIVESYFGVTPTTRYMRGVYKSHVVCEKLCTFLVKCGFSHTTALEKKTPWVIRKSSEDCLKSFLQGLYDTDGCCVIMKPPYKSCEVKLSTSSLQLAKEVQAILLNFGIVGSLLVHKKAGNYKLSCNSNNKVSKCATSYKVSVTGISNLMQFRDKVGFRCDRKMNTLCNYFELLKRRFSKSESIPNSAKTAFTLAKECKKNKVHAMDTVKSMIVNFRQNNAVSVNRLNTLLEIAEENNILTEEYYKLKKIIDLNLSFVKMIESDYFFAPTVDVEVENESCYWSNGMISHNSKMIFSEVEKIYDQAPLVREAAQKKPIRSTDSCYLKFKSVGGVSGSFIEALPLGSDGGKIRGSRFYTICIDELAQVPSKIVDMVIRPFAAATLSPMENVRQKEQEDKLLALGLASKEDFKDKKVNKMIMMSSGFYKFNHMWKRMKDHWYMMDKEGEDSRYSVWQIPYTDLPPAFLDMDNINESKRIMADDEFKMEYEAEMISDSEGFFKASLIESCSINSGFSVELTGNPKASYVLGVDPNQAGSAGCGVIVVRLGEVNRVVKCIDLKVDTTQKIAICVQTICSQFNIIRILMDKGGGGKAVCDLLEEGYNNKEPIIDITNKDHINMKGRHILEMVIFTPSWISDANFTAKALLETNSISFPEPPIGSNKDETAIVFESIEKLKSQMRNIVVTQTGSGVLHFDTPKKHQNKDLYSALILAAYGIRSILKEQKADLDPVLYNSGGLVRSMDPGAHWEQVAPVSAGMVSEMAVLTKKSK